MLITPPGTSEEFNTSAKVTEHKGIFSEAKTTQVLPLAITGIMVEKPTQLNYSLLVQKTDTTPVGSGCTKIKNENLQQGFTELK